MSKMKTSLKVEFCQLHNLYCGKDPQTSPTRKRICAALKI